MCFNRNKHIYFNYSDFTRSYEPFSQALKSFVFDYILSGSKGKIAWRRKMQTKRQLKQCPRNVHPPFADFQPSFGVNFHILLTQNWLWESSLSLLSLWVWCILFWIKLGLFSENLNLKKHVQPKNGWSLPITFWNMLILIDIDIYISIMWTPHQVLLDSDLWEKGKLHAQFVVCQY